MRDLERKGESFIQKFPLLDYKMRLPERLDHGIGIVGDNPLSRISSLFFGYFERNRDVSPTVEQVENS